MIFTLITKFNLRQVSASIMRITYGINVKEEGDEYIAMLETAMEDFVDAMSPGKYLVEFLPFLKYVPTWVPGAHVQRLFVKWREDNARAVDTPYDYAVAHQVR